MASHRFILTFGFILRARFHEKLLVYVGPDKLPLDFNNVVARKWSHIYSDDVKRRELQFTKQK